MSGAQTPFHAGELSIQDRVGVKDALAPVIGRFIRDYMPEQHQEFYAQLPFVMLGAAGDNGACWATMVCGPKGFMQVLDPFHLRINAFPSKGDPVLGHIRLGVEIGLLGIELETRRRNRLHGVVVDVGNSHFTLKIRQTFGNCPKYIQRRSLNLSLRSAPQNVEHLTAFDAGMGMVFRRVDTLFIASSYGGEGGLDAPLESRGFDVSHRGGKPGFIKQLDAQSLIIPDFQGNLFFNTLGNIALNPKCGIFIPDFKTRSMIYMSGIGEVIFDDPLIATFKGAQRLLKFTANEIIRRTGALPFDTELNDYAPELQRLGEW